MVKRFNSLKTGFILVLILVGLFGSTYVSHDATVAADETKTTSKFYTFNSYIYIEYDETQLNKNLAIDESLSVPVTVKYKTDVPENFLSFLPWQLRNLFIFGSIIGPMQTIHLEVVDKPDWADVFIATPDVIMDIPVGSEVNVQKTSLVLSPKIEAPSTSYTISIKATSKQIGRINSYETEVAVTFTPSFVPTVTIIPENPTRTVAPRESVNFKISVTNEANKKARITPSLNYNGSLSEWSPTINPPFMDLNPGDSGEFILSIYTPYTFGWHNEIQAFQIDFITQIFPLREDAPVGGPYPIYIRVNNYGFSTPGFESAVIFVAIACIILAVKRKQRP